MILTINFGNLMVGVFGKLGGIEMIKHDRHRVSTFLEYQILGGKQGGAIHPFSPQDVLGNLVPVSVMAKRFEHRGVREVVMLSVEHLELIC